MLQIQNHLHVFDTNTPDAFQNTAKYRTKDYK